MGQKQELDEIVWALGKSLKEFDEKSPSQGDYWDKMAYVFRNVMLSEEFKYLYDRQMAFHQAQKDNSSGV